jgi:predicted kinase
MRTFVILRGPLASGRTTFVREQGLLPWHVDQSAIEALTCELAYTKDGSLRADRSTRPRARDRVLEALNEKFMRGSFVIFEPTDTGSPAGRSAVSAADRTILAAIEAAKSWRYEILIIDFASGVTADEIQQRQLSKADPLGLIDSVNVARNLAHMRRRIGLRDLVCNWTTPVDIMERGGLLSVTEPNVIDIDDFDNIVAIGDIHGCIKTLQSMIGPGGPRDDVAYIFTGDYINKGPRSAQVMRYLLENFEGKKNSFFLRGNHERPLEDWSMHRSVRKKIFNSTTLPDIEACNFSRSEAQRFLAMLLDAARFRWNGNTILATHGGYARPPQWLCLQSAEHLSYGAEDAAFDIDAAWEQGVLCGDIANSANVLQIHGHRNEALLPVCAGSGSFNLEGAVETGGCLRAVVFRRLPGGKTQTSTLEVPNCEHPSVREPDRSIIVSC